MQLGCSAFQDFHAKIQVFSNHSNLAMTSMLSSSETEQWKKHFEHKVIWLTGASSGIGEQLAYVMSSLGASLILSARAESGLERVKNSLGAGATNVRILPLDLELLDTLPAKVAEAESMFGRIDILINNAGLAIRDYILNTGLDIDQKLMKINYFGPLTITKAVLKSMMERGHGQVVAISSLSAKYGVPRTAAYAASKHALQGFFECLRTEITLPDIHFTIIIPGIIKTDITAHALMGDGSKHGKVELTFQEGYPVEKAALKIMKAIALKKEEQFVGGMEGVTLWFYRISPYLFTRFIRSHPLKRLRKMLRLVKKAPEHL